MEFYQKVCFEVSWSSLNIGHVELKCRSIDQICLKPCSPSRGISFASILINFYQNVCLDDGRLNLGHVLSKTRSLGRISLKPFSPSQGHSFL